MAAKHRVLYLMHSSSKYQGSNKSLLNILIELKADTFMPFVMLPIEEDMSICQELQKLKIPYVLSNYSLPIYPPADGLRNAILFFPRVLRLKFRNLITTFKLIKYCTKNKINLIHSNVGPILIGFLASKYLGIPHVWHLREYQDLHLNLNTFYSKKEFVRKLKSKRNYVITISEDIKKHFFLNENTCVIYNGIFHAKKTLFIKEKENYFLFVGYLSKSKGIETLLQAFLDFLKEDTRYSLKIVGNTYDRNYYAKLMTFISENQINNNIEFLGYRDDVPELMAKATALIMPSISEGFGRTTAEALFNGCLVIGHNSGGTKEILEANDLGILFNNQNELFNAIKLIAAKGVRPFFSKIEKAQKSAAELYSIEQNVSRIKKVYQHLLN